MRAVFLGTPKAAVPALLALLEAGHHVARVITRPDRPVGRSARLMPPAIKRAAAERGLPVDQPRRVRDPAFRELLLADRPDVLVVTAYGRILPQRVLELAPFGAINLHFSLLPRYRGAAPVQWALANGERRTGVTTMQMSARMDEGDILLRKEVAIEPGEHAPALEARLARIGAGLLLETLEGLVAGRLSPERQDPDRVSYAPLLRREHGEVEPSWPAERIEGCIRGFDPWPGVWLGGPGERRLRLVEGRALPEPAEQAAHPGEVLELRPEGLVVACGQGSRLLVTRIQAAGRRPLEARDAVNGRLLVPGDRLVGPAGRDERPS